MTANGLKTVDAGRIFDELRKIIDEYQEEIGSIVVGMPKMMDGSVGIQGEKVLEFVKILEKEIPLPVTLWDERLSTVTADNVLIQAGMTRKKRKGLRDKVAATVILQNYLDSRAR